MFNKILLSSLLLIFVLYLSCSDESVSPKDIEEPTGTVGTVTDIDNNVYQTIKIGKQWWMTENLKVIHYRNGDALPNVIDNDEWKELTTGAYCHYENDSSNVATYGKLYNWYAISDTHSIAPEGWHIPTDDEWKELEIFLGMSQNEVDKMEWRGTDEGGKLKETGVAHWYSPNTGATNEYGFTALASGNRNYKDGHYNNLGFSTTFWLMSDYNSTSTWHRSLRWGDSDIHRTDKYDKKDGFSVRCISD